MSETLLCPPQGDFNPAPTEEDLRRLFFQTEPTYWLEGSGDAGLHRDNEGTNMIFHCVVGNGFCSLFQGTGGPPLVLIGEGAPNEIVSAMLNGNTFDMRRSYLTNAEAAFAAALAYLKTGALNPGQRWEPFDAVLEGDVEPYSR